MNMATIGTLSTRYAKALYLYAVDHNEDEKVYEEMKFLSQCFLSVPELRKFLLSPIIKLDVKLKLLATASGSRITDCSKRFYEFIFAREKHDLLLYISLAYLSIYRKAKNIVYADLVTATDLDSDLLESIKSHIMKEYNGDSVVELSINSNPDIIGGFILSVDGKQLDLSVRGELKNIRKSILKNL
jgi:F-type H+-transporting ATPase subunit delta